MIFQAGTWFISKHYCEKRWSEQRAKVFDALPSLPLTSSHSYLAIKAHLRWGCLAWFPTQTISVSQPSSHPATLFLAEFFSHRFACLFVCIGSRPFIMSFSLSSLWAHERGSARGCLCTHICAQTCVQASRTGQVVRTWLTWPQQNPATSMSQNKPCSHLELLAFVSVRFGH